MKFLDNIIGYINSAPLMSAAHVPTTPYTGGLPTKTVKKGSKGADAKKVQKFLNWSENAGLKVDSYCGSHTVAAIRKFQKRYKGLKVDGIFGNQCRSKAKKIVAAHAAPTPAPTPAPAPAPTPAPAPVSASPNADKIVFAATSYAYPSGTAKKKYQYKTGKPRASYKAAIKAYMGKKAKISCSDCGYFVSTCVRAAGLGSFNCLQWKTPPATMAIVLRGKKIPAGFLQPGDIIRYKKTSGGQHTLMYYGNGKVAEANRGNCFPRIHGDTKKYNKSNVKKSTLQVIRAK